MNLRNTDFSVKKQFLAQRLIKKVILTILWDMKDLSTIGILLTMAHVKSYSYCQLLLPIEWV